MEPANILHVHNLTVELDGTKIVDDVSFFVNPQEVLAIVGPNGAGKSVLLKTLIGLLKPVSGKIEWQKDIRIGYLPQRFHVERYLPMTVEEFLGLKPKRSYTMEEVLSLVGLDASWLPRNIAHLSSGQLQKVLLAWTLLDKPHILLFDEPTENVDVVGQESVYTLLHTLQDELGLSLIIVSHDLHVVFRYANKVLCLNKKMVCYGEPESALTNVRLSELYGDHAFFHHHHFNDTRHDHHDD